MIVDFTAQLPAFFWTLSMILVLLAVLFFAGVDPELAEVYLGEGPLFAAAVALAALVLALAQQLQHVAP